MSLLDDALAMAARGWRVFPCEVRGKRPLGALAPHGLNDATDDLEQVRAWWTTEPEANIGLATGRASGVVVIDLDGEAAEDAYGFLLYTHGAPGSRTAPDGASVRTGSGWHLYLNPGDYDIRNSASRVASGIDVRGDGGYVVAPPSVHPSGRAYVWRDEVPPDGLPVISQAWATLLAPPPPPERQPMPAPSSYTGAASPYGAAALRGLLEELATAGDGSRNDTLNKVTWRVVHLSDGGHLDLITAASMVADVAESIGLPQDEITKTMASAMLGARRSAA